MNDGDFGGSELRRERAAAVVEKSAATEDYKSLDTNNLDFIDIAAQI